MPMPQFDQKTLVQRLEFKDGTIDLMGKRLMLYPSYFIALYTEAVSNQPKHTSRIYYLMKNSMAGGFADTIGKSFNLTFGDYIKFFIEVVKMSGWGITTIAKLDETEKYVVVDIADSPIATYLRGKVDSPCDHVIRGFLAGGTTLAFGKEVDAIEIECTALGAERCRFMIDSIDKLSDRFPIIVKDQIW